MAPLDYFNKLKFYYAGRNAAGHEAVLSPRTAAVLSIFFTSLYVVPFYLSPKTRPSPTLNRDAPSVIKARIQTVTGAVCISTVSTLLLLSIQAGFPAISALHYVGLYPVDPVTIIKSVLLTLILYVGPLYETIYVDRDLSPVSAVLTRVRFTLASWQGYRNYIAGPLTEELLFRSSLIPVHLLAHVSATNIVFLTPLYFGIAHIHHFYEFHLTHPHTPLLPAILRSAFQFAYTTVFGWYASFIYLRTGNLYAVFVVHAFCNWMGLPRLWGRIRLNEGPTTSPIFMRGKEDSDPFASGVGKREGETPVVYSVVYYLLLVAGASGFFICLFSLTSGADDLASFSGS